MWIVADADEVGQTFFEHLAIVVTTEHAKIVRRARTAVSAQSADVTEYSVCLFEGGQVTFAEVRTAGAAFVHKMDCHGCLRLAELTEHYDYIIN